MIPLDLALAIGIVFAAMVVRGFTGFGGALLMVPLLGLVWDIRLAVVIVAMIQFVTGAMLVAMARRSVNWSILIPVLLWSAIGLVGGSLLLANLPVGWITGILGVVTIVIGVVTLAKRITITQRSGRTQGIVTGIIGLVVGVLHGLIGTSGPVIVPYLQRVLPSPGQMRSTLLALFLILDVLRIGGYFQLGVISTVALQRSTVLVPAAIAGSLVGSQLHVQVSDEVFRVAIAVLLIVSGALLLT